MLKQLYVQQIDIQRMQNITRQLRDNQSMKNNSIPLSALTYNAPAGYAPLTHILYYILYTYIYTRQIGSFSLRIWVSNIPIFVQPSLRPISSVMAALIITWICICLEKFPKYGIPNGGGDLMVMNPMVQSIKQTIPIGSMGRLYIYLHLP